MLACERLSSLYGKDGETKAYWPDKPGVRGIVLWKAHAPCTKNGGEVVAFWPAKPGAGGSRSCNAAGVR